MAGPGKETSTAVQFFPQRRSLSSFREAARGCQACELWKRGTQTVFGEGPRKARVLFVGEQPGHEEDLAGNPFVGPAGRLLDKACEATGIDRSKVYVTNVVKHFKWVPKGKRRIHQKPSAREIGACLPWLEAEIELIKPEVLVCLGATAAQTLLGKAFRVSTQRGQVVPSRYGLQALATVHPSSILRMPTPEERHQELDRFIRDLQAVAHLVNGRR